MRSKENRTRFINKLLGVSIVMLLSSSIVYASALPVKAQLSINLGVGGFGTPPADGLGSNFGMETAGAGSPVLYTPIVGNQGIKFKQEQFSRAANVAPLLTEVSSVDNSWAFFGSTGVHGVSVGGITISNNAAPASASLDFSNWYVSYNNNEYISMGGDPVNFPADTQVATLTCAVDCAVGDTYILNYSAHVPMTSAVFPGTAYVLHLEGTISDLNVNPTLSTPTVLGVTLSGTNTIDVSTLYSDAADSSPDAIDCTAMSLTSASGAATQVGSTCVISYTDVGGINAVDSFTFTVGDASGGTSNTATVNVLVNDAPVAANGSMVVTKSSSNTIDLAPLVTDTSTSTIDWTTLVLTNTGTETLAQDTPNGSTVTYTDIDGSPIANDPFTYTVEDNTGAISNSGTINVKVNNPPTATAPFASTVVPTGTVVIDLSAGGTLLTDSDGTVDCTSFATTYAGTATITDNNDCTVDFKDNAGAEVLDSFQYTFNDTDGAISNQVTASVDITSGNVRPSCSSPSQTIQDGQTATVDLRSPVCTDADGIDWTSVIVSGETNGTVTNNDGAGVLTFTPAAAGAASFDFTVDDLNGVLVKTSVAATASITVNAAPVASPGELVVQVSSSNTINLSGLVNDPAPTTGINWATLDYSTYAGAATITDDGNGVVTYLDNGGVSTADSFDFTVQDKQGGTSNSATISVIVNAAPVAPAQTALVPPSTLTVITLNATDADGALDCATIDTSTYVGTATLGTPAGPTAGKCTMSYTDAGGVDAIDSFSYTVADTNGTVSNSATVTVMVNGLPVATTTPLAVSVNRNSSVAIDAVANVTDADAMDATTVTIGTDATNGTTSVDAATGVVTYTPTVGSVTNDSFTYTVKDVAGSESNLVTVNITVSNNLPVAINDSAGIDIYTKSSIALDVTANDTDSDGSLDKGTVAIVVAATNGATSIDPINGVVTYTPNIGFTGADTYQYTITDNDAELSAPATVTINVSDSSAIAGLPIDALMSFTLATNTVNPVDGEGSWFAMDSDGLLYTAIESYNGIQLGTEQSASGAHVGVPDGTERKDIDEPWLFFGNTGLHQSASKVTILSDDGAGNVTLDFSGWNVTWNNVASIPMGTGAHTGGTNGVAVMNCAVNCAVGDTYILNYYATVPVGDPSGFGSVAYTLHLEGTITQGSIPATSPVANNDAAAVAPLGTVQIDLTDNVYDQFGNLNSDIDFTTLTYAYVGTATVVNNNDGTFSYTDIDGVNANDSFTFKVSNTAGETSNTAKVTVAVQSGNLPPVASDFSQQVWPDVATDIDITSAVTDDGTLEMATLSASQSINGNGTTSVDAITGMVTYTPNTGFTGSDSFSYTIKDTQGATSNLAYVSVFVNAVPVAAANSSVTVERNTPTDIDVTLYVTDADGTINTSSVVIDTTSSNGSAVIDPVTGVITYTPSAVHDLLPDSFTYTVRDNAGAISNAATINIVVVNAAPVAVNDAAAIDTTLDSSVVINVLANDSDADGSISVASVAASQGSNGSTSVDALGVATYTPNGGFVGSDQFTYTVNDNDNGISNVATVVVSVSNSSTAVLGPAGFLSIEPANITSANKYTTPVDGAGSWFNMEVEPGVLTHTAIQGFNQLQLGTSQPASAASPDIDSVWIFFGNQGVHQTTSAVTILTDDGNGNVTLDLSGWDVSWNSIASIPMDSNAQIQGFVDGVAIMTCAVDCSVGDSYILEYSATVPVGDASGFGGVKYFLHLEGTIDLSATTVGGGDASALYTVTNSIVSDNPSLTIVPGATAVSVGNTTGFNLSAVDIGLKDPRLNEADGQQCIGGCLDFEATGVTGDYMDLVVYLSEVIPEGANYRKLMNGIWQDFDESQGDLVGSAPAVAAACQGTNGVFQIGLRAGNQCLFLRIYDGGPNDADGLVNGTIVDPSGVLVAGSPNVPASSADGCSVSSVPVKLTERADWLLVAAFIAGFGLLAYRRRERNIR